MLLEQLLGMLETEYNDTFCVIAITAAASTAAIWALTRKFTQEQSLSPTVDEEVLSYSLHAHIFNDEQNDSSLDTLPTVNNPTRRS